MFGKVVLKVNVMNCHDDLCLCFLFQKGETVKKMREEVSSTDHKIICNGGMRSGEGQQHAEPWPELSQRLIAL